MQYAIICSIVFERDGTFVHLVSEHIEIERIHVEILKTYTSALTAYARLTLRYRATVVVCAHALRVCDAET